MKEQLERIQELENLISKLPQGSITYKTIHGKKQPYLQWTENGKTRSKYIKIAERDAVMEQVSLRRSLQEELKNLKAESSSFVPRAARVSFETNVVVGRGLYAMTEGVRNWEKWECGSVFEGLGIIVKRGYLKLQMATLYFTIAVFLSLCRTAVLVGYSFSVWKAVYPS